MFLYLDGRPQGGMQFGVLVLMVLWDAVCGELVTVWVLFCDIDARVLSGMQVTVQVHVLGGAVWGALQGDVAGKCLLD